MSFLADIGIVERTAQKRKVGKPSDRRESSKSRFQLPLIWYCTYCNNVYTYICFFFVSGHSAQVYILVHDEKCIPPSNFNRRMYYQTYILNNQKQPNCPSWVLAITGILPAWFKPGCPLQWPLPPSRRPCEWMEKRGWRRARSEGRRGKFLENSGKPWSLIRFFCSKESSGCVW